MKKLLLIGKLKSNKNEEQLFFIILHAMKPTKHLFITLFNEGHGVWGCGEGGNGDCEGWAIMLELH